MPEITRTDFIKRFGYDPFETAPPIPRRKPKVEAPEPEVTPEITQPVTSEPEKPIDNTVPVAQRPRRTILPVEGVDFGNEKPFEPTRARPSALGLAIGTTGLLESIIARQMGVDEQTQGKIVAGTQDLAGRANQAAANAASGAIQVVGDIPGFVDIVRAGGAAGWDAATTEAKFGDAFMNQIMKEGGIDRIQQQVEAKLNEVRSQNPDWTDEQLQKWYDEYQDSEEFFNTVTGELTSGVRASQIVNNYANKIAGTGTRPDEQTLLDDIEQIAGSALVGLPKATVEKLTTRFVRGRLRDLVSTRAGRIGARTLEAATPLTLPLTPGNVALNAGVGAVIDDAVREVTHAPGLINTGSVEPKYTQLEDPPETPETLPQDDFEAAISDDEGVPLNGEQTADRGLEYVGISLGGLFGIPAFRRSIIDAASPFVEGGPRWTDINATKNPAPQLGPGTSISAISDQFAPVRAAARVGGKRSGMSRAERNDFAQELEADLAPQVGVNGENFVNGMINHGVLDGVGKTVPLTRLRELRLALSPDDATTFDEFIVAQNLHADRAIKAQSLREDLNDEMIRMQNAQLMQNGRAIAASQKRIAEITKDITDLQTGAMRLAMPDWDLNRIDAAITNGRLKYNTIGPIVDQYKQLVRDMATYMHRQGMIDSTEYSRWVNSRPFYMPFRQDILDGTEGTIRRQMKLWRNALGFDKYGKGAAADAPYQHFSRRDLSGEQTNPITKMQRPLDAIEGYIRVNMRAAQENKARRTVVDKLARTGLSTNGLKHVQFNGRPTSFTKAQLDNPQLTAIQKMVDNPDYTHVYRDGRLELWEFGDKQITRSLEFAPVATIPILNWTRRAKQLFTTGIGAPWFAVKAALWDVPLTAITRQPGRSFGYFDTYARRLFNENQLINKLLDANPIPDPTAWLQAVLQVPMTPYRLGQRALAERIATDLARNSGVFGMIAKLPHGDQMLRAWSNAMLRSFDDSIFAIAARAGLGNSRFIIDPLVARESYRTPLQFLGSRTIKRVYRMAAAVTEGVHEASSLAFFATNYSRLKAKYNGQIPKKELQRLAHEARKRGGDMTRVGLSDAYNKTVSAIPYANAIVQGTRNIASAVTRQPINFGSRLTGAIILPAIGGAIMMSTWSKEAADWYYNQIPTWMRMFAIPMPTAETLYHWALGEPVEFTPDAVMLIPIAPEFVPFVAPVLGGLRSMGIVGPDRNGSPDAGMMSELRSAIGQSTSFMLPPVVEAYGATQGYRLETPNPIAGLFGVDQQAIRENRDLTFGGVNADKMHYSSDISRTVLDVVSALIGTSGNIAMQTLDAYQIERNEGAEFDDALMRALKIGGNEAVRRIPDVPLIWNTQERAYSYTPQAEYVYHVEGLLQPLEAQRSVNNDSKDRRRRFGNEMGPPVTHDRLVNSIIERIHHKLYQKGPYKQAKEAYTEAGIQLNYLDNRRTRMSMEDYNKTRNLIVSNQQLYRERQMQELIGLLGDLDERYGPQFEEQFGVPINYENIMEAVRATSN